jgi:hypothetical protein
MKAYQEALNAISNHEDSHPTGNDWHIKDFYPKELATLQELIDLHEPKEIKVGQVWECVNECYAMGGKTYICIHSKDKDKVTITDLQYSGLVIFKGGVFECHLPKEQFQACFKLVKDVE